MTADMRSPFRAARRVVNAVDVRPTHCAMLRGIQSLENTTPAYISSLFSN
jgi:hypothetical protein